MNNLVLTFCIYFLLTGLIIFMKPNIIFKNKNLSRFGIGKNKTLLPLWLMILMIGILSYVISVIIILKIQ